MVSQEKRDFIKKVGPGISVCMDVSYKANDIAASPEDDMEVYIRDTLLTTAGTERWCFSVTRFSRAVDTLSAQKLTELLLYLDDMDMNLHTAYLETRLDWSESESVYEELVASGQLTTFDALLKI